MAPLEFALKELMRLIIFRRFFMMVEHGDKSHTYVSFQSDRGDRSESSKVANQC